MKTRKFKIRDITNMIEFGSNDKYGEFTILNHRLSSVNGLARRGSIEFNFCRYDEDRGEFDVIGTYYFEYNMEDDFSGGILYIEIKNIDGEWVKAHYISEIEIIEIRSTLSR